MTDYTGEFVIKGGDDEIITPEEWIDGNPGFKYAEKQW